MGTFLDTAGEGLAVYGRIRAIIGAVIGTIVCLVLFGVGIHLLTKDAPEMGKVTATYEDIPEMCTSLTKDNQVQYVCSLNVTYTVDGQTYEKFLPVRSSVNYKAKANKEIEIYYQKSNPDIISTDPPFPRKTVGWVLVIASPILLIVNLIYTYIVLKNKSFATVMGGVGAVSDIAQLF